MKSNTYNSRREFLQALAAGVTLASLPTAALAQGSGNKMKIGIIGSGRVGSAVGGAWVNAGHEVMFSSLDLEADKKLAASLAAARRLDRRAKRPPLARYW